MESNLLNRRTLLVSAALSACIPAAFAQEFPNRPITLVVPYAAGGPTDQLARELGAYMTTALKQPVVVENRPGGGAQIAVNMLKNAPADGHTILIGDVPSMSTNIGLFAKLQYDPRTDLVPVTQLTVAPGLFVVPNNSPFKTLQDLVNHAKKNPNKPLSYASQGVGSGGQLFSTLFAKQVGVPMTHVPYRGSAPGLMDVISGTVDFFYDTVPSAGNYVTSGKMRALAVGEDDRVASLPNVPTLKELGLGDIVPTFWYGAAVKAGTSPALVDKLAKVMHGAMSDPVVSAKFLQQGALIRTSTPAAFRKYTLEETDRWVKVMKDAGMKAE